MKFGKLSGVALLSLMVSLSCAKQTTPDHPDHAAMHDHSNHSAMPDGSATPAAQSYADAVKQIQSRMTSLDALVKAGKYDDVHKDSEAIRQLCGSLGDLAAAQNSPVPKDKVKEVTESAKELSAATRSFHGAAHDEDLPQVKEHYAHMGKLIESLAAYVVHQHQH